MHLGKPQLIMLLIGFGILLFALVEPYSLRSVAAIIAPQEDLRDNFRRPSSIPHPKSNPYTETKYHLGKKLFFDPRLSRSDMMSCASCHNPSFAWGNGLPLAIGDNHQVLGRRVPTILNLAWGDRFFWDGRAKTLEEQALGPIQAAGEMNMPLPLLVKKLKGIPQYVELFRKVFPAEGITPQSIGKAIATFERTVVSERSPFDEWVEGDESAISKEAKLGFEIFNGKANCIQCHNGWNFTNGSFADIGIDSADLGRGDILKDEDVHHTFKTPTLRDVELRGPYMHDGSLKTLEQVIENYDLGGMVRRKTTKLFLKPLSLSDLEKEALIAFLKTLTGSRQKMTLPSLPTGGQ